MPDSSPKIGPGQPVSAPRLASAELQLPVQTFATGWQTAMHRGPRIRMLPFEIGASRPRTVSIQVRPPQVATVGFQFGEAAAGVVDAAPAARHPIAAPATFRADAGTPSSDSSEQPARIRPPRDVVKLQDRLYYVLQPPLESLVAGQAMEMPFEPFGYQYQGIAFLYPRHAAVLADEMGLGKTMQAITTIRLLLAAGEMRRVLLVCPKPLVTNWLREFSLWAPEVVVAAIEGDRARRHWLWNGPPVAVRIANYELLMRDRELLEDPDNPFDLVVLDEAQRIKNRSSTTSQVVRAIPRTRSWALTGTPVENSPEDLVGLFEFLVPGYLNREMTARRMGRAVGDYVLRRTKDMVLTDLPPKMFRDAELHLTSEQAASYQSAEEDGVVRLNQMGRELTIQHVFELVLRLKQICNFDPATGSSCKLERLEADLEEVAASGKKAIVFSQWVETIRRLSRKLERFQPLEYHGKIRPQRRDAVIEQFRNQPEHTVLLMSYGAGSVGLNLQFCGYVFLFDRWWNPAVEDQAINRAHRIGVEGPVTVTRMMTAGTIEQRIHDVLEDKRQLFATIFDGSRSNGSAGLSQDEIFGLFNLRVSKAAG